MYRQVQHPNTRLLSLSKYPINKSQFRFLTYGRNDKKYCYSECSEESI